MLTDMWLRANHRKVVGSAFEKSDRDGLSVRVSAKGKVVFQMRYRFGGKPARLSLGSYPALSLRDARDEGLRLRGFLERGQDPAVVLMQERMGNESNGCLSDFFYEWYEKDCRKKKKGHHEVKRSFELHVLPVLGGIPVGSLLLQQWIKVLEDVAKDTPSIADRLLTNSKQMYRWLVRRQIVEVNPLVEISAWNDLGIRKKNTYRSLDDDELRLVLEALRLSRMSPKNKVFVRLCLLYGCRPREIRIASRDHFDFSGRVWTVPAKNHKLGEKTGKPLLRPIIEGAEVLIREAMSLSSSPVHLFTNANSAERMSRSSPLPLPYNLMQWLRSHRQVDMTHWSIYALRKTARTNWSTLTQPHIAEIMLGHKLPGDWQTYDQYHYLPEQSEALQLWYARLSDLGMQ